MQTSRCVGVLWQIFRFVGVHGQPWFGLASILDIYLVRNSISSCFTNQYPKNLHATIFPIAFHTKRLLRADAIAIRRDWQCFSFPILNVYNSLDQYCNKEVFQRSRGRYHKNFPGGKPSDTQIFLPLLSHCILLQLADGSESVTQIQLKCTTSAWMRH